MDYKEIIDKCGKQIAESRVTADKLKCSPFLKISDVEGNIQRMFPDKRDVVKDDLHNSQSKFYKLLKGPILE